jgi:hypothetical protein
VQKTALVISTSGVLGSMVRGTVTSSDLENAIFFLDSTMPHVWNEHAALMEMKERDSPVDEDQQREVHRQFRLAIEKAEISGRIGLAYIK